MYRVNKFNETVLVQIFKK